MKLSIIIVNYFSEDFVLKCIRSINQYNFIKDSIEIIIVDNGSNTRILNELESSSIKLITNKVNKGFGAACNLGFERSNAEYVLFLNPDTRVFKETLQKAISFMERNPDVTVLGCQQVDEQNNILKTCTTQLSLSKYIVKSLYLDKLSSKIFKSHQMSYWNHMHSRFVDHVMGSFYMIKSSDFIKMKGFDENFFVYYEDLDLSKRIIQNGGKIFYNTDFKIYHKAGGSSKNFKAHRLFYSLDATLVYGKKHFSKYKYRLLALFILGLEPFLRFALLILKLDFKDIKQMSLGFKLLYAKRVLDEN